MKITILGSCRQDSLYKKYHITKIKNEISYPHYTKEVLEVINYLTEKHLEPSETLQVFRTPRLKNSPIMNYANLKKEFDETDLFIIEIASRKKYLLNNHYVHHIFYDDPNYNVNTKDLITLEIQSDTEIENDILNIKNKLKKPIIIVSHLVTRNHGERHELAVLLKNICKKHNILFRNPIDEILKKKHNIDNLFLKENILSHYNDQGHNVILDIYTEFINKIN